MQGRRRGSQQSRLVLAQIAVTGLELEESAGEEKDPPEDVDQFVEQDVEEGVGADRGRADRRLVVNDDIAIFVFDQSTFQTAVLQQEISDANLVLLESPLDQFGAANIDSALDVKIVVLEETPAVHN